MKIRHRIRAERKVGARDIDLGVISTSRVAGAVTPHSVPAALCWTFHMPQQQQPSNNLQGQNFILPIFKMRKLKLREMKKLAQAHLLIRLEFKLRIF